MTGDKTIPEWLFWVLWFTAPIYWTYAISDRITRTRRRRRYRDKVRRAAANEAATQIREAQHALATWQTRAQVLQASCTDLADQLDTLTVSVARHSTTHRCTPTPTPVMSQAELESRARHPTNWHPHT
jgi:hypothetical protein